MKVSPFFFDFFRFFSTFFGFFAALTERVSGPVQEWAVVWSRAEGWHLYQEWRWRSRS